MTSPEYARGFRDAREAAAKVADERAKSYAEICDAPHLNGTDADDWFDTEGGKAQIAAFDAAFLSAAFRIESDTRPAPNPSRFACRPDRLR